MIDVRKIFHRGEERIGLFFSYDETLIAKIKTIKGRKYSKTLQCWYLPCTIESFSALKTLGLHLTGIESKLTDQMAFDQVQSAKWSKAKSEFITSLKDANTQLLSDFMDYMLLFHYPLKMIKAYTMEVSKETKNNRPLTEVNSTDIQKIRAQRCYQLFFNSKNQGKV